MAVVVLGIKSFSLWSQVTFIHEMGWGGAIGHEAAHYLRYVLVAPIFYISSLSGIHYDQIFSIVAVFLVFGAAVNVHCLLLLMGKVANKNIILLAFILISFFMNGRLLFAFLGISILARVLTEFDYGVKFKFINLINIPWALLLCSISTGTAVVAVFTLYTWILSSGNRFKSYISYISLLGLFFVAPTIKLYIWKNIDYYGGAYEMLSHGAGAYFYDSMILMGLLLIVLFSLLMTVFFSIKKIEAIHIVAIFCLPGGLFGYSTLLCGTPAFISIGLQKKIRIF